MNHRMWLVSLVGILRTAVVFGTDMFFLDTPYRHLLKLSLFIAASFSLSPGMVRHEAYAGSDPRVETLIQQSGVALHANALRSIGVIHAQGSVEASGLLGSGDNWYEMGNLRHALYFSTPPLGGG